jgi:hypothetical protein
MKTLKFRDPQPSEENDRFVVIEDRDTRVLVADATGRFDHYAIRPTFVYLKSDLIDAENLNP